MNVNREKCTYAFGEFEIDPGRRVLFRDGVDLKLKPKTIEVLLALIERAGEAVAKNELLERVWGQYLVEEKNLSVHIAALRKVFGETKSENRYIATLPGTGYSFVAEVTTRPSDVTHMTGAARGSNALVPAASAESPATSIRVVGIICIALITAATVAFWKGRNDSPVISAAGAASIKQLTTNGHVSRVAISPDGKLFAYCVDENGKRALYSGFVAGGKHTTLVEPGEAMISEPAFSPDSSFVYFGTQSGPDHGVGVYRSPASGGTVEKLLDGLFTFKLSADGRFVYFGRRDKERNVDLVIARDISSGDERELADLPARFETALESISLSPEGMRLAVAVRDENHPFKIDLAIKDISTGNLRRIKSELFREIECMTWANGRTVLVSGEAPGSYSSVPHRQIYEVDVESGVTRPLTGDLSVYESSLSADRASGNVVSVELRQMNNISIAQSNDLAAATSVTHGSFGRYDGLWGLDFTPDGKIIFTSSDSSTQVISVMNADGSDVKQLTAPGNVDSALSVTPDGRHIVFLSYRDERTEIWRMNIDGSHMVQLTHAERAFQPFISADGKWVYYMNASAAGAGRLERVTINGGEAETLTESRASWGAASPDGKFLATGYEGKLAVFDTNTMAILNKFDMPKTGTVYLGVRWTPDSAAIIYRDRYDGYWSQGVLGGPPARVDGLPHEMLYNFSYSKDGKQFAFVRGLEVRDVVLITRPQQ